MSFEGFYQKIGVCGHQWEDDASCYNADQERKECPVCGAQPDVYALVDTTNGYGEEYGEYADRAKVRVIGFTDSWHEDHYGNKYAVKHPTYSPVGKRWVKW